MTDRAAVLLRLLAILLVVSLLAALGPAREARAHGGRIQPPPDPKHTPGDRGYMPGRAPTDTLPPPPIPSLPNDPRAPAPITPGGGTGVPPGQKPTQPTPAPGSPGAGVGGPQTPTSPEAGTNPVPATAGRAAGRRSGATNASPWQTWEMWWELNRWSFFPERGTTLLGAAVVTPAGSGPASAERRAVENARRAIVTRQHITPFLLGLLDPARKVRDEVRAAALLALAKVTHDEGAVDLIFRHAEDAHASNLVRESAALAVGMLRRDATTDPMDGGRLDVARARLLVLVDDEDAPDRARVFAALAIGMLGDQPFGSAFTRDGRVVTRALWERAVSEQSGRELPIALLTALGMQPPAGTADGIKEDLQRVVHGRHVGRRSWDDYERGHALMALVRQGGDGWPLALMRVLTAKRMPAPVRQAAFIALGAKSAALCGADRRDAMEAAALGMQAARDNVSRGLGLIALGRLVGADLASTTPERVARTAACATLLGQARHGAYAVRGFAAVGLGLALRGLVSEEMDVQAFLSQGKEALAQGLQRSTEPRIRAAYAVALGLLGTDAPANARTSLAGVLSDRDADPDLRGHAALALAQMGDHSSPTRKGLRTALWDKRSVDLRSRAALALSFLGGREETRLLIQELRNARSQWVAQQVTTALGQLGDIEAVAAIAEVAADTRRADEVRALAVAALGLIGDPTAKPSMLRLSLDAHYPALTPALHEAMSIL